MKAINFDEQNEELGNGLPGYYNVPIYKCKNEQGTVIMKIQMTKEQWEDIGKNDFSFWYTREVGKSGLQPFSFAVESPFVQLHTIQDLSASGLEAILKPGSKLGNYHVSRDITLFEIVNILDGNVSVKRFNTYGETIATNLYPFEVVSQMLTSSDFNADWFIIHPKE